MRNAVVCLSELRPSDREAVLGAVAQTVPEQWLYMMKDATKDAAGWFDWLLEVHGAGKQQVFVVRDAGGAVMGCTSYTAREPLHKRVEIGNTWYVPQAQGGKINPAAKLLMIGNGFDALGCWRVELKCDSRNLRSMAAMRKMGAVQEGTLRGHMEVPDHVNGGTLMRDTVYFSVLKPEWPRVQAGLLARL